MIGSTVVLQSIAFAPPTPNGQSIDATRTWTTVKPGDQRSGLTFTLAQGAGLIALLKKRKRKSK